MPRQPRKKCNTKIYHCILRGINKQDIFLDKQDYLKFKKEIKTTKEIFSYKLYSYVLMSNHIHLQIKDEKDNLSKIMQSIQIRYADYFNKKYNRVGHLFQDKFKSQCVESDYYILNLQRYIHQNPIKAGIGTIEGYLWSSYREYISQNKEELVDKEEIFKLFSEKKEKVVKKFIQFNNEILNLSKSDEILEYEIRKTLADDEIIDLVKKELKIKNIQEIQGYEKQKRNDCLKKVKKIKGCTQKQLSRILGINIRIIQRT